MKQKNPFSPINHTMLPVGSASLNAANKSRPRFNISDLSLNICGYIKLSFLFFPILAAAFIFGYIAEFLTAYICAALHETAHIRTAKSFGIPLLYIEIQPFGISARLSSEIIKHPLYEALTAAAGPAVNLIIAAAAHIFMHTLPYAANSDTLSNIIYCNIIYCNIGMAIINLLPVLPLDGGRILRASLSLIMGNVRAYQTAVKISRIPVIIIIAASIYGILSFKFNFSLILISAFILSSLAKEQSNISLYAVNEIIHHTRPEEITHKKAAPIYANGETPARFIIRYLSYNRCHIVYVCDNKGSITKTLTESQILSAISSQGIRIRLKDIK